MTAISYVLITPARDEERFIELTLRSVVAQTHRPLKWIIVSDGSTDRTDEIVGEFAALHPWIELLRMPPRPDRHFAGKVYAFNAGYERVQNLDYQVIGSLDADISFDQDYFSYLLGRLAEDSALGVIGTPFQEAAGQAYDYRFVGIEHVSGACQLFRRQCFEDIGGYRPVKGGGIDSIAVFAARMKGWKTRTFSDKVSVHHREIGTAQHGALMSRFQQGIKDYRYGGHPLWELFRTAYQVTKSPLVVGGLMLGTGYLWALTRRLERSIPPEMVAFRRREQMQRLRRLLGGGLLAR